MDRPGGIPVPGGGGTKTTAKKSNPFNADELEGGTGEKGDDATTGLMKNASSNAANEIQQTSTFAGPPPLLQLGGRNNGHTLGDAYPCSKGGGRSNGGRSAGELGTCRTE